jgi:lipopolysaccharide export system protein LptA
VIRSVRYDFQPGLLSFSDEVRADNAPDWNMACQQLEVRFTTGDRVESIQARREVRIELLVDGKPGQATGEEADYTVGPEGGYALDLRGNPVWRMEQYEGRGDLLRLESLRRKFSARGNASFEILTLPANPLTSVGSHSGVTNSVLNRTSGISIRSEHYEFADNEAVFNENVQASQIGWKLTCRTLRASLSPTSRQVEKIQAQDAVRVEQIPGSNPAKGGLDSTAGASTEPEALVPWVLTCDLMRLFILSNLVDRVEAERNVVFEDDAVRATGGYAVYTATNDIVTLTNNPVLITARGPRLSAPLLILDRKNNTFSAEGDFAGEVPSAALGGVIPELPDRLRR